MNPLITHLRHKLNNISQCKKCNRFLIAEEESSHICHPLVKYRMENCLLWVFDGILWYPLKRHQPKVNTNNTTDKETEPNFFPIRTAPGNPYHHSSYPLNLFYFSFPFSYVSIVRPQSKSISPSLVRFLFSLV